jgi:hypothetical protein
LNPRSIALDESKLCEFSEQHFNVLKTVTGPDVDFDDATSVYSILYNMRNSAAEMFIKKIM